MKITQHPLARHSFTGRSIARARRGFTLAEMMVVIVIIGLLATLVVPNVLEKFQFSARAKAKADIAAIVNALTEYATRNAGKFPDSLEALITPDTNGYKFLNYSKVPKDPWKNEYMYEPPQQGTPEPRVFSYGPDNQPGNEDDVDSATMNDS